MIEELKTIFGSKCTAISVNGELTESVNTPSKSIKLCEALHYSFHTPLKLTNKNLGCPGARRSIGFDNDDSLLSQTISANNKIPVRFIQRALKDIPKLTCVSHLYLGITGDMEKRIKPDLYIIYVQPAAVTTIMHFLAKAEIKPSIAPYSLLSVCGNVFSNCYKNNLVSISFGCPESRKHGGIGEDEVVLGLPFEYARFLIHSVRDI